MPKLKINVKIRDRHTPVRVTMNTLNIKCRKILGSEVDKLNEQIKSSCPAPSLVSAFYVTSILTKTGQSWFIGIKELTPVSERKGWGKIQNEYSTYQKIMAVEYGRPAIPRSGRTPLFSAVSTGHGGVQRYMGTLKGVSPKAKEIRDAKPSVIIRMGPIEAVSPTFFIKNAVDEWELKIRNNIITQIDSLLAKQKKK